MQKGFLNYSSAFLFWIQKRIFSRIVMFPFEMVKSHSPKGYASGLFFRPWLRIAFIPRSKRLFGRGSRVGGCQGVSPSSSPRSACKSWWIELVPLHIDPFGGQLPNSRLSHPRLLPSSFHSVPSPSFFPSFQFLSAFFCPFRCQCHSVSSPSFFPSL